MPSPAAAANASRPEPRLPDATAPVATRDRDNESEASRCSKREGATDYNMPKFTVKVRTTTTRIAAALWGQTTRSAQGWLRQRADRDNVRGHFTTVHVPSEGA